MSIRTRVLSCLLTLLLIDSSIRPALALTDAEAALGRTLVENHAASVVNVEIRASIKFSSTDRALPPREQKIEVNGTMLSEAGLTVIPLSSADPRPVIGRIGPSGAPTQDTAEATITAITMRLPDGTELPAKLLAKDVRSALAFIAPNEPSTQRTFPFLPLEKTAPAELLQTCLLIARTPPGHRAVPLARITYVTGVFEEPIRCYLIPDLFTGTPVFTAAGKLVGIVTAYIVENRPVTAVVVPADEVTKAMKRSLSQSSE